jgi:hypothetical protein
MSQSKLFDYNSSFMVIRTNPRITGNLRITIDSSSKVSFNSMDANQTLSNDRFKNFNINGENTFALDVFNFFDKGKLASNIIFDAARFTRGDREVSKIFSDQYDFFYASGASALADKNYKESFSYFAPLWLKSEIPDYFVIFKVPGPLSYIYSKNETVIKTGVKYKIVKNYDSDDDFIISYGKTLTGEPVFIKSGTIFTGSSEYQSYSIFSGAGIVCVFDELYNIDLVDDVTSTFRDKILPNCSVIKTFDLTKNSKIGKYIRDIVSDKNFTDSPIDINWGPNSYTYYNGVSISEGIYTRKGEIISGYFSSDASDRMIDFESYVTSGFSRNSIIPQNLLNLEFLFDDDDADNYTINRYFGMYVSRNDLNEFRSNGEFYYKFKDLAGNENLPKPTRDAVGYYYNNESFGVTADSGVRLFYEKNLVGPSGGFYSPGILPGSDNINIFDSSKLYYVTDKRGNFYSLKRDEGYTMYGGNSPKYAYGPYDESVGAFGTTGSNFSASTGSLVLQDTKIDLLDFTGITEKISTIPATRATTPGRAYIEINFLKNYNFPKPLVFKLYWPNGTNIEGTRRYDVISSADLSAVLVWIDGSYYSTGSSFYFNAASGNPSNAASALAGVIGEVDSVTWDAAVNLNSTVVRLRDYGEYGNNVYSISVFDDYEDFISRFKGEWSNSQTYYYLDIVLYMNQYYIANNTVGPTYATPDSPDWVTYFPFGGGNGYLEINGTDIASATGPIKFIGGTRTAGSRLIFQSDYLQFINPGDFINTKNGYSKVNQITRYVDSPERDPISEKVTGFEDFTYDYVLNIDENIEVDLGYDRSFNVYKSAKMSIGIFSFFDVKEFDFDFWSSDYGYTPTPETYKYFQIPTGVTGLIKENVPYLVKQGQVEYAGQIYPQESVNAAHTVITSNLFYGATGFTSIKNARPDLYKELVVIPAEYSDIYYNSSPNVIYGGRDTQGSPSPVGYNKDFDSFNGFIGIQDISPNPVSASASKIQVFNRGKLETEYEYLNENYSSDVSNASRIVPIINKWGYTDGTDARGNQYRLNSSPAFSPTNFSPSIDKNNADSRYLTHEWFLLEQPPRNFPIESMKNQNSYLPQKIDLNLAIGNGNYLESYFTVEPSDYSSEFSDPKSYTKELFTTFTYNKSSGFYETLFRGIKIILKKRSNLSNGVADSLDRYVPKYRNYEDYKFAAILRPITENNNEIQEPVKYRIIENQNQKFILFVCDIVMEDYKSFGVGYTGGTGGNPILDYTLLYSVNNKENLSYPLVNGSRLYDISDIKLSAALNLSVGSGSVINTTTSGKIGIIPNPKYDTDLREEVHTFFSENSTQAQSGPSATGPGSFYVNKFIPVVKYPWPIGVGPDYMDFGKIVPAGTINPTTLVLQPEYSFDIYFSPSTPQVIPVGPLSIFKDKPVFQKKGGSSYYSSILQRISLSGISSRVNSGSQYIQYETYKESGDLVFNDFEFHIERPSKIIKTDGSKSSKYFGGPQTLGESVPTGYTIESGLELPSILLRYSGGYEPIFRKIIHFDKDKSDCPYQVQQNPGVYNLSFRNCNFAPYKRYFGISRNLSFTKVSPDKNILSLSQNLPEGPVYPLVGQSPIWRKDFNVFSSSWDPGYYDRFTGPLVYDRVAGTRAMKEYKGFLGSKIMKTPDPLDFDNYITLQILRAGTGFGSSDVSIINSQINSFVKSIQYIDTTNSGTGIGKPVPYISGVDYDKLDLNLFPYAELIWQYFPDINKVKGIVRLDRMLSRYLLNDGIKQVFIDNIISEFGVGNPDSIDDDVTEYIKNNVLPLYMGDNMDLYVQKEATTNVQSQSAELLIRGDIVTSDKYQLGYENEADFKLTKLSNLIYTFEYNLENNYKYSLLFNLGVTKI